MAFAEAAAEIKVDLVDQGAVKKAIRQLQVSWDLTPQIARSMPGKPLVQYVGTIT